MNKGRQDSTVYPDRQPYQGLKSCDNGDNSHFLNQAWWHITVTLSQTLQEAAGRFRKGWHTTIHWQFPDRSMGQLPPGMKLEDVPESRRSQEP